MRRAKEKFLHNHKHRPRLDLLCVRVYNVCSSWNVWEMSLAAGGPVSPPKISPARASNVRGSRAEVGDSEKKTSHRLSSDDVIIFEICVNETIFTFYGPVSDNYRHYAPLGAH